MTVYSPVDVCHPQKSKNKICAGWVLPHHGHCIPAESNPDICRYLSLYSTTVKERLSPFPDFCHEAGLLDLPPSDSRAVPALTVHGEQPRSPVFSIVTWTSHLSFDNTAHFKILKPCPTRVFACTSPFLRQTLCEPSLAAYSTISFRVLTWPVATGVRLLTGSLENYPCRIPERESSFGDYPLPLSA